MASERLPKRLVAGVAVAVYCLVASLSSPAHAGGSDDGRAHARALMKEGRLHREQHDLPAALASFLAADDLMGVPTTAYEVAATLAALHRLLDAKKVADRILAFPLAKNAPAQFVEARAKAEKLEAELLAKLASVKLKVPEGARRSEYHVDVDGVTLLETAELPLRVEPGHHEVVVTARGETKQETFDLVEGETKEIALSAPPALPPPVAAIEVAVATQPPPAPIEAPPAAKPNRTRQILIFGGGGAGIAGVVVGAITGAASIVETHSIEKSCSNDACPTSVQGRLSTARTLATVSDVSFVVAGAGAAALITGLVLKLPPMTTTAAFRPWVGAGQAGVSGQF